MRATGDKSKTEFTTQLKYSTKLNIKIPLTLFPDEVGDVRPFNTWHFSNSLDSIKSQA